MDRNSIDIKQNRAARLSACGFTCAGADGQLAYAEYEFQLYSMNARWLARRTDNGIERAPSEAVCDYLTKTTEAATLGEPWNAIWEKCLLRWEGVVDPDHPEGATETPYVCPVVIDGVGTPDTDPPSESSPAPDVRAENVWLIDASSDKGFFFARDFSGMFAVAEDDPAYRASTLYTPPKDNIFGAAWLYSARRSFMQVQNSPYGFGVVVQPWKACELLPALLGPDAGRIYGDSQWRGLFRLIRAVSDIESKGFFDRLQGYDGGNLSAPLFHYTLNAIATNKAENAELGGLLAWVDRFDPALGKRLARLGFGHAGRGWSDDGLYGKGYECASGSDADVQGKVVSTVSVGGGEPGSSAQMKWLRMPHVHYRFAMLLRTEPALREAVWKLGVHRLRNVAWLPIDFGGASKVPLGTVLTSEQALAIALRLHVWQPGNLRSWVAAGLAQAQLQLDQHPSATGEARQAIIETAFCAHFRTRVPTDSNLEQVWTWPSQTRFKPRLRQKHLEGDNDPAASDPMPPPLSTRPYSSPFFKRNAAGIASFTDPVDAVQASDGFKAGAHPPASRRFPRTDDAPFARMGVAASLPAMYDPALVPAALTRQRLREALAAVAAPRIVVGGVLQDNPLRTARRPHGDTTQFWARRMLSDMQARGYASSLRFALSTSVPQPEDSLWAVDVADGATVYVSDCREAQQAPRVLATRKDKTIDLPGTDGGALVPGNFGVFVLPVAQRTFRAFARALEQGLNVKQVDAVRVSKGAAKWSLSIGGLRQDLPAADAAQPSEWGFWLEYVAWAFGRSSPETDGWAGGPFDGLRMLGLDAWVPDSKGANPAFLRQDFLPAALGLGSKPEHKVELDELRQVAVPRLWDPRHPAARTTNVDLAAALLSWPSLYRIQRVLQTSQEARRGLYDIWRMGMRAVLGLPIPSLQAIFGKPVLVFQLFQTEPVLAALSVWRRELPGGLRGQLASSEVATAAKDWVATHGKEFASWSGQVECDFFRQVVLKGMPDPALRTRLAALATVTPPEPEPQRDYKTTLGDLLDIDGLDTVLPPLAASDYQPVMLDAAGAAGVRIGLLVRVVDTVALSQEGPTEFLVGGIVPAIQAGPTLRAVPLMLPEPVRVKLGAAGADVQVAMHWAPGAPAAGNALPQRALAEAFTVTAPVGDWLGGLAAGTSLALTLSVQHENDVLAVTLGLTLDSPWLYEPLAWSERIAALDGLRFQASGGTAELAWKKDFNADADWPGLPLRLRGGGTVELVLGLDGTTPRATLALTANEVRLGLGTPAAELVLEQGTASLRADLVAGTAGLECSGGLTVGLNLELAEFMPGANGAVRVVSTLPKVDDEKPKDRAAPLRLRWPHVPPADAAFAASAPLIDLSTRSKPRIAARLFDQAAARWDTGAGPCEVLDIAREWIGGLAGGGALALTPANGPTIAVEPRAVRLTLPVALALGPLTCNADLQASCVVDGDGYLDVGKGGFACDLGALDLEWQVANTCLQFGGLVLLTLPKTIKARFVPGGGLAFLLPKPTDGAGMCVTIPVENGFKFDVSEFALGAGGLTLSATVSRGAAQVALPVLEQNLTVRAAKDGIGTVRIERGRIAEASLAADVRLRVFDDADGVLTLRVVQAGASLTAVAELDVGVGKTFNLRALYLKVLVDSIHLGLRCDAAGHWSVAGGMTGSLQFAPSGPLGGRLAEYGSLFSGTTVHFENLDLAHLGSARITVLVTPQTFDVAEIFSVTWRGFVLEAPGDSGAFLGVRLLGDIAFKQRLPNLRTVLTLGDIRIWQDTASSLIPRIKVSSLGVDIGLAGGFSFKGVIAEYDDEVEYGFGGKVELRSDALPATVALLKLTRLRDEGGTPAIAVFAAQDREDSLGYGFFLRRLGIGAGIHQGLRGFSGEPLGLNLAGRVERALRDPRGLPDPGQLSSWVPRLKGEPQYLLAASALISFGLLPMDKDHPMVGSAVLAVDDNCDIIMGLNGWFATSPSDALTETYQAAPAIKGAVALSPREQVLYGRFMTLPNSKFGKSADTNPMLTWLRFALERMRLSVAIYADPRGALLEIGYPREARFQLDLGLVNAQAEGGFRFGFYRGTHVAGLNLAAQAEMRGGFSADLGFANIELSARAGFQLQASFAGALTLRGEYYLYAETRANAYLELSAHVYKRIRIKFWHFSCTVTLFDFSGTLGVNVTAMLGVGLVPGGIGFGGQVEVDIVLFGFHIRARVNVGWNEDRVGQAKRTIDELVPPIADLIGASHHALRRSTGAAPLALAAAEQTQVPMPPAARATALPRNWRWFAFVVGAELRLVLFPDGEHDSAYPAAEDKPVYDERLHTIRLSDEAANNYVGLVGSSRAGRATLQDRKLILPEQANGTLLPLAWLRKHSADAPRDVRAGDMLQDLMRPDELVVEEVVDPRTAQPLPGDFDDPAVLADPRRRSTRFRARYSKSNVPNYDDHLRKALAAAARQDDAAADEPRTSSGELLLQLTNLARDAMALAGQDVAPPQENDDEYSAHLLASRMGLVLAFKCTQALQDAVERQDLAAILDFGHAPQMFGLDVPADRWRGPRDATASYAFSPGYVFQTKGEVGLVWAMQRRAPDAVPTTGLDHHRGIGAFRVTRRCVNGQGVPPAAPVRVLPQWLAYTEGGTRYYVRPQFQFLDSTLPPTASAFLEYEVVALADDGSETPLATHTFVVDYQPPAQVFRLTQAGVLLPLARPAGATPLTLDLFVEVEVTPAPGAAWGSDADDPKALAKRIRLYRRPVPAGRIGRYGEDGSGTLSVSWDTQSDGKIMLPTVDQARQLTVDDLECLDALSWQVDKAGTGTGTTWIGRATYAIDPAHEQAGWDGLLGAGRDAAELHVCLAASGDRQTGMVDLATPLLRCRITLVRPAQSAPDGHEAAPPDAGRGTEVAALERLPLAALAGQREREWVAPGLMAFKAEVARVAFGVGRGVDDGATHDVALRLRGMVDHWRMPANASGPVVGYRVWCRDVGPVPQQGARCVAEFQVDPERLFRSAPRAVFVRRPDTESGANRDGDWLFERGVLHMRATLPSDAPPEHAMYAEVAMSDGRKAAVHASVAAFLEAAREAGLEARAHADEPLAPSAQPDGGLLPTLLARYPEAADLCGWALLEAIGACMTTWLEDRNGRLDPAPLLGLVAKHPDVAAIAFSHLRPGERPDDDPLTLYGVRVFAVPVLAELLKVATSADGGDGVAVPVLLGRAGSHLAEGLRLGGAAAAKERDRIAFVEQLAQRIRRCAQDTDGQPVLQARMWEARIGGIDTKGQGGRTPVLPVVAGQVHYFQHLQNGYARQTEVAVEAIRRYHLVEPDAARPAAPVPACVVDVPRTQALQEDQWVLGPDPATGGVRALVSQHPAQRAALASDDLARQVQLFGQTIALARARDVRLDPAWQEIFTGVAGGIDSAAFEAACVVDPAQGPLGLDVFPLDVQARAVSRGIDEYRFDALPPFYAYGLDVQTLAGVRHSAEARTAVAEPPGCVPMFSAAGALRHDPPQAAWQLDAAGNLSLCFALARGIDALPAFARRHWIERDETCAVRLDSAAERWTIPVLFLPDPQAAYRLVAVRRGDGGPELRMPLVRFAFLPAGTLQATVLGDGGPVANAGAAIVQLGDGPRAGRLGIQADLSLATPAAAVLRDGLAGPQPSWDLEIHVERDGIVYAGEGATA